MLPVCDHYLQYASRREPLSQEETKALATGRAALLRVHANTRCRRPRLSALAISRPLGLAARLIQCDSCANPARRLTLTVGPQLLFVQIV